MIKHLLVISLSFFITERITAQTPDTVYVPVQTVPAPPPPAVIVAPAPQPAPPPAVIVAPAQQPVNQAAPVTAPPATPPPPAPGTTTTTTTTAPAAAPAPPPPAPPAAVVVTPVTPVVVARESDNMRFHFGFKFSPTIAWIKPDSKGLSSNGSKLGFSYGIITEFNFQENYAFATGLQVTYRGGKVLYRYNNDNTFPEFEYKINIQYIELPLTLKMKTNDFNNVRFFGQFGFAPGINIRANAETDLTSKGADNFYTLDPNYEDDFKDYINTVNLSMIIAAGAEFTISGTTVLFTSLEFNNGFIDVFNKVKQPHVYNPPNDEIYPRSVNWTGISNFFAFNFGILF
jgi:hypothetical protein